MTTSNENAPFLRNQQCYLFLINVVVIMGSSSPPPPPASGMSNSSWWMSTSLFFLFGSFGAVFAAKEFGDPVFSDWIRPGPGSPLLGDAGRMQEFENAIQSMLLGIYVNRLEGGLLALGTVGMLLSPFSSNLCQFLTCALVPLEAWYYMVNIVFLPMTGALEATIIVMILGVALQALCLWRLQSSLALSAPNASALLLNMYLFYMVVSCAVAGLMVYRAAQFDVEMIFYSRVRDYFWKQNGMTWTKGMELPDGFSESQLEDLMEKPEVDAAPFGADSIFG